MNENPFRTNLVNRDQKIKELSNEELFLRRGEKFAEIAVPIITSERELQKSQPQLFSPENTTILPPPHLSGIAMEIQRKWEFVNQLRSKRYDLTLYGAGVTASMTIEKEDNTRQLTPNGHLFGIDIDGLHLPIHIGIKGQTGYVIPPDGYTDSDEIINQHVAMFEDFKRKVTPSEDYDALKMQTAIVEAEQRIANELNSQNIPLDLFANRSDQIATSLQNPSVVPERIMSKEEGTAYLAALAEKAGQKMQLAAAHKLTATITGDGENTPYMLTQTSEFTGQTLTESSLLVPVMSGFEHTGYTVLRLIESNGVLSAINFMHGNQTIHDIHTATLLSK